MHLSRNFFCLPPNWITPDFLLHYYLFRNYFLSYVYLKDICKNLKEIEKIQFVSVKILLSL